ncbi:MAG TPA: sigma 54-interacting transcriptional regulator [bacterium]|nr:sigma 54-interacting transcriptional regulator [bacterium]
MGWQLAQQVSAGGTSEVYEARTPDGRKVAVKLLTRRDAVSRELFEKQALLLVRLRHPNVVPVLGFLRDSREIFGEDRGPCYWMEFVEGEPLPSAARKVGIEKILEWFEQAVETLSAVHAQGVVHGDLSPQNLRIAKDGLKILDFSVLPGDASTTETGTLPYMAPERITGRTGDDLPPAVDLFSLGTVFYEAFARRHPRAGARSLRELIDRVPEPLIDAAPSLSEHSVVARVIDRMIRTRVSERFSGAEAVREALSGEASGPSSAAGVEEPLRMLGADAEFETVSRAIANVPRASAVIAVHGPSGVGKTRFVREAAFEAALRGLKAREYTRLHRAGVAELGKLLANLRSLPASGELVILEWNDADLTEDSRRFFDALLADGLARDVRLKGLNPADARALLETVLKPEDAADLQTAFFGGLEETPGKILKSLKALAQAGRLRKRGLVKGWRELLRTPPPPMPAEELKASARAKAEAELKQGRTAETLEIVDAGLEVVSDPAERSRLLRLKINALNALGRYEPALAVCHEWLALAANDEPMNLKTVKYRFTVGWILQNLGRDAEAVEAFERCVAEGTPHADAADVAAFVADARSLSGVSALRLGDTAGARAAFEDALRLIPEGSPARAETYRNLARAHAAADDDAACEASLAKAFALYEAAGREDGVFWALLESGNLRLKREDFGGARSDYARAEDLAKKADSDLRLAVVWNNRGLLEREAGNPAEALDLLHRAQDVLRFLGNANDLAYNLKELAVAEAQVGRMARAESFLKGLRSLALSYRKAAPFADETETAVAAIRDGTTGETAASLKALFDRLPPELQVSFVDRGDYRRLLGKKAPKERPSMEPKPPTQPIVPMGDVLATLTRLNERLAVEEDIPKLLARLMDAAMDLARAENGFLILRSETSEGPLPGYRVAAARNIAQEELETDLYAFSLSAVRRALQTGEPVLTDNAVLDPIFEQSRSVHLRQLKSIVALPVRGPEGVLGVFYLDHRFQEGLFGPELLDALKAFASVASLAFQKGRMIEELRRNNDDLSDRVRAQSMELNRARLALKNEYSEIVGRSRGMVEVLSMVDRIADSRVPVWIFGESGTGKEAIARALHAGSPRAKKTFVTENCGALPESLMESELFGHKKGAFTHATSDRQGILKYADGGTIFLDEIADMSPALQAKLLRFLQEGEIRPVGSTEVLRVDVRVVSASNRDLSKLVAEGKFREDLYYRLNGVTLKLPPLRERMEDLSPLIDHFLKRIAEREKKAACRLAPPALNLFLNYRWPGNIRELQNTLETAALFAENGLIGLKALQFKPDLLVATVPRAADKSERPAVSGGIDPVLEETLRAVKDNGYHKGHAAEALGISRRALYGRFQKFGLATDVKTLKEAIDHHFGT